MTAYGEIAASLDAGSTLPFSWYTDPAVLALEQRHVFMRVSSPRLTWYVILLC